MGRRPVPPLHPLPAAVREELRLRLQHERHRLVEAAFWELIERGEAAALELLRRRPPVRRRR